MRAILFILLFALFGTLSAEEQDSSLVQPRIKLNVLPLTDTEFSGSVEVPIENNWSAHAGVGYNFFFMSHQPGLEIPWLPYSPFLNYARDYFNGAVKLGTNKYYLNKNGKLRSHNIQFEFRKIILPYYFTWTYIADLTGQRQLNSSFRYFKEVYFFKPKSKVQLSMFYGVGFRLKLLQVKRYQKNWIEDQVDGEGVSL